MEPISGDKLRGHLEMLILATLERGEAHGLEIRIAQCSTLFNKRKGTLRGLHYQVPPAEETG